MAAEVREVEIPADALALATLPRVDYTDAFRVHLSAGPLSAGPELSGEDWARETFEGAPERTGAGLRCGWTLLGLDLAPRRADGSVLGWRLRHGEDFAVLALDSWIGLSGELLFRPEPGGLLFATMAELRNPVARAIWAPIAPLHRRIVSALLRRAAGRVSAGRPACASRG